MGDIYAKISEEIDDKFRKAVFAKFGLKKGNIQKAVEEAIKDWTEKNKPKND